MPAWQQAAWPCCCSPSRPWLGATNPGPRTPRTLVHRAAPASSFRPIRRNDCALDHVRNRLYVTTLNQLVVVDVGQHKILETIDLLGNVQGLDMARGAKCLVIAPVAGHFLNKLTLGSKTTEDGSDTVWRNFPECQGKNRERGASRLAETAAVRFPTKGSRDETRETCWWKTRRNGSAD